MCDKYILLPVSKYRQLSAASQEQQQQQQEQPLVTVEKFCVQGGAVDTGSMVPPKTEQEDPEEEKVKAGRNGSKKNTEDKEAPRPTANKWPRWETIF